MALNDIKEIQIPDSRYRQLDYIKFQKPSYSKQYCKDSLILFQ